MEHKKTINEVLEEICENEHSIYKIKSNFSLYVEIILKYIIEICYTNLSNIQKNKLKEVEVTIDQIRSYHTFNLGSLIRLWKDANVPNLWKSFAHVPEIFYSFPFSNFNNYYKQKKDHVGSEIEESTIKKYYYEIKCLVESIAGTQKTKYRNENLTKHNLPAKEINFLGRENEINKLMDDLKYSPMKFICGIGGIGKTALAKEIAWKCYNNFLTKTEPYFETIIWTSAKKKEFLEKPIDNSLYISTLEDIFSEIIRVADPLLNKNKPLKEDYEKVARSILEEKKVFLIIDNMESIEDEKVLSFMSRLPAKSKALITDRSTEKAQIYAFHLKKLPELVSKKLIIKIASDHKKIFTDNDLQKFADQVDGNPLGIIIAMGQIVSKGLDVDDICKLLRESGSDSFLNFILDYSYRALSENSKTILKILNLLDADENEILTGISGTLLCNWAELNENLTRESLQELISFSLISEVKETSSNPHETIGKIIDKKFGLNQQVRDFIDSKIIHSDEKIIKLREFIAKDILKMISLNNDTPDWPSIEIINRVDNNIGLVNWAMEDLSKRSDYQSIIKLFNFIAYPLEIRGHRDLRYTFASLALQAAKKTGDNCAYTKILLTSIVWTKFKSYTFEEAENDLQEGIDLAEKYKYELLTGIAYRTKGQVYKEKKEFDKAEEFLLKAHDILEKNKDDYWICNSFSGLSSLYREMENFEKANIYLTKSYDYSKKLTNGEEIKSIIFQKMATMAIKQNMIEEAQGYNNEARNVVRILQRQIGEAYCDLNDAQISMLKVDIKSAVRFAISAKKRFLQYGNKGDIKSELDQIFEKAKAIGINVEELN